MAETDCGYPAPATSSSSSSSTAPVAPTPVEAQELFFESEKDGVLHHCLSHFLGDKALEVGRAIDALTLSGRDSSCRAALVQALVAGAAAASAADDCAATSPWTPLQLSPQQLRVTPTVTPRVAPTRAAKIGSRRRSLPPDLRLVQPGSRSGLIARLVAGSLPPNASSTVNEGVMSCALAASCARQALSHLMPPGHAPVAESLLREALTRRADANGGTVTIADVEELLARVLAISLPGRTGVRDARKADWPAEPSNHDHSPGSEFSPRSIRKRASKEVDECAAQYAKVDMSEPVSFAVTLLEPAGQPQEEAPVTTSTAVATPQTAEPSVSFVPRRKNSILKTPAIFSDAESGGVEKTERSERRVSIIEDCYCDAATRKSFRHDTGFIRKDMLPPEDDEDDDCSAFSDVSDSDKDDDGDDDQEQQEKHKEATQPGSTCSADAGAGSSRIDGVDRVPAVKKVASCPNIADGDGAAGHAAWPVAALPLAAEQQPPLAACSRRIISGAITVRIRLLDGTMAADLPGFCAHETVHEVKIRLFSRDPMLAPHRQKLVHGVRVLGDDELLSTVVDPGSGEVSLGLVRVRRTLVLSTSKDGKLLLWDLPDGMLAGTQSALSTQTMTTLEKGSMLDGGAGLHIATDTDESESCFFSTLSGVSKDSKDSTGAPVPLASISMGTFGSYFDDTGAPGHVGAVAVDWTRPRAFVAVDNVLKLWDLSAAACGLTRGSSEVVFRGHSGCVYALDVQWRDGKALSGSQDKTVRLWDVASHHCLRIFEGHQHTVRCVVGGWSVGQAISGGTDHDLWLWNLDTGLCSWRLKEAHRAIITAILADWENGRVLTAGETSLRLWSLEPQAQSSMTSIPELEISESAQSNGSPDSLSSRPVNGPLITAARFLPGSNSSTGMAGSLKVGGPTGGPKSASFADEALTNKHLLRVFTGHQRGVTAACAHWQSNRLLSAARDDSMRLWNIETGECVRSFNGSDYGILSLAVDWGQGRAVSGSGDRIVRIWDLDSGEVLRNLPGHTGVVCGVALS